MLLVLIFRRYQYQKTHKTKIPYFSHKKIDIVLWLIIAGLYGLTQGKNNFLVFAKKISQFCFNLKLKYDDY